MGRFLRRLIKLFSNGGKSKSGRYIAQDLRYASELKQIGNWERTRPEVYEYWSQLSKEQRGKYLRDIKQRKLTSVELKQRLNKQLNKTAAASSLDFKIKKGIPFAAQELKEIDRITNEIIKTVAKGKINQVGQHNTWSSDNFLKLRKDWDTAARQIRQFKSKTGQDYQKHVGNPFLPIGTKFNVHVVTKDVAKQIYPSLPEGSAGWADLASEGMYIVQDYILLSNFNGNSAAQRNYIIDVITHEVAHAKDPRLTFSLKTHTHLNPKSKNTYDPHAPYIPNAEYALSKKSGKNWLKNYYFHDIEIVALFAPILKLITKNTETIVKRIGKQKTIKALDEIAQWLATGTPSVGYLSADSLEILGRTSSYKKLLKLQDPMSIFSNPELDTIQGFFTTFKQQNPKAYKQVINKTARQIEDLKGQVKRTRSLTPESIIKYKVLI